MNTIENKIQNFIDNAENFLNKEFWLNTTNNSDWVKKSISVNQLSKNVSALMARKSLIVDLKTDWDDLLNVGGSLRKSVNECLQIIIKVKSQEAPTKFKASENWEKTISRLSDERKNSFSKLVDEFNEKNNEFKLIEESFNNANKDFSEKKKEAIEAENELIALMEKEDAYFKTLKEKVENKKNSVKKMEVYVSEANAFYASQIELYNSIKTFSFFQRQFSARPDRKDKWVWKFVAKKAKYFENEEKIKKMTDWVSVIKKSIDEKKIELEYAEEELKKYFKNSFEEMKSEMPEVFVSINKIKKELDVLEQKRYTMKEELRGVSERVEKYHRFEDAQAKHISEQVEAIIKKLPLEEIKEIVSKTDSTEDDAAFYRLEKDMEALNYFNNFIEREGNKYNNNFDWAFSAFRRLSKLQGYLAGKNGVVYENLNKDFYDKFLWNSKDDGNYFIDNLKKKAASSTQSEVSVARNNNYGKRVATSRKSSTNSSSSDGVVLPAPVDYGNSGSYGKSASSYSEETNKRNSDFGNSGFSTGDSFGSSSGSSDSGSSSFSTSDRF